MNVQASGPGTIERESRLPTLDVLLDAAGRGEPIEQEYAAALVTASNGRLEELCAVAATLRDQGKGRTVTFSPKVFIPLTRLCRDFCGYCTFRQDPVAAGTKLFLTPEDVLEVARAGQRLGCTEALFTLGERPEQRYSEAKDWLRQRGYATTLQYLADMCRLVTQETSLLPPRQPGHHEPPGDGIPSTLQPFHGSDAGKYQRTATCPWSSPRKRSQQAPQSEVAHH